MSECKHSHLTRLEGPLHSCPNDYVCNDCGQQVHVMIVPIEITVSYGQPGEGTEKERI
jgi:hypothetical protein